MRGVGRGRSAGRTWASWSCALSLLGGPAGVAGATAGGHVAPAPPAHPALEDRIPELRQARQAARERLGDARCQAVLTDFRSVSGLRLDEVLRASGRTAQEQLDLLRLESGLGRPACDRRVTRAFTRIHSSVVSICLRPFTLLPSLQQQAVLIHELLHSLGLGEGPPESLAITARVLARCGP